MVYILMRSCFKW